jgi:hypothetical protein
MEQQELDLQKKKHWTEQPREWFYNIPIEPWDVEITDVHSIVILPEDHLHDSGWGCMSFVLIDEENDKVLGRIGGGSYAVYIGGIAPTQPNSWIIDCLPVSQLLRIHLLGQQEIRAGQALSSFEIFAKYPSDSSAIAADADGR